MKNMNKVYIVFLTLVLLIGSCESINEPDIGYDIDYESIGILHNQR